MTSYDCLLIVAVCKRCKANLALLRTRESDLDNDENYSDDGNKGDDDESDDEQEVIVISLFKEGDVITCYSFLTYGPLRAFYPPNHDTPQKTDHNTGNYMPYSLRQVCGFFYVPQDYN